MHPNLVDLTEYLTIRVNSHEVNLHHSKSDVLLMIYKHLLLLKLDNKLESICQGYLTIRLDLQGVDMHHQKSIPEK